MEFGFQHHEIKNNNKSWTTIGRPAAEIDAGGAVVLM